MAKCEFQPKQWVLVRDDDKEPWKLNIFSHKEDDDIFWCVSGWYGQCISYKGNENLLGKTKQKTVKEYDGWKVGDNVEVKFCEDDKWYHGEIVEIEPGYKGFFDDKDMPYRVRSACFESGGLAGKGLLLRRPDPQAGREARGRVQVRREDRSEDRWQVA